MPQNVVVDHCQRQTRWWGALGCESRKCSMKSVAYYADCVAGDVDPRTIAQIDLDVPRTLVHGCTSEHRSALRNVLVAFACHSPRIGYCQGLNVIAAVMISVFFDEERAFWGLLCAIDCLGVEDYYTDGMELLRVDMRVLCSIFAERSPRAAGRFEDHGMNLMSICSGWFITWFAKALPEAAIFRFWDVLFSEGFEVLFRFAVSVLDFASTELSRDACIGEVVERSKWWPHECFVYDWGEPGPNENSVQSDIVDGYGARRTNRFPPLCKDSLLRERDAALDVVQRENDESRRRARAYRRRMSRDSAPQEMSTSVETSESAGESLSCQPLEGSPLQSPAARDNFAVRRLGSEKRRLSRALDGPPSGMGKEPHEAVAVAVAEGAGAVILQPSMSASSSTLAVGGVAGLLAIHVAPVMAVGIAASAAAVVAARRASSSTTVEIDDDEAIIGAMVQPIMVSQQLPPSLTVEEFLGST
eukprot:TRINITY_DN68555_c0_g1_i1.p1 TRINITY_DN68555_c0_g1~~TRINITY_DN68555_c0_g1_i1.p1  ORF type:complete len:473 (+),score=59.69 TRINITY_DN68555_c0_g1_i1:72-1490(+)